MELDVKLKQNQKLSPSTLQLVSFIQMSTQELEEYITNQAVENPMLDVDESTVAINRFDKGYTYYRELLPASHGRQIQDDDIWHPEPSYEDPVDTIKQHLVFQIDGLKLNKEDYRICRYLVEYVDSKGFITDTTEELADALRVPVASMENCLDIMQSLSPKGICTPNVSACLINQLGSEPDDIVCAQIIEKYLDHLAQGHYSCIAKELNISVSQVKSAKQKICSLSPFPADGFFETQDVFYINPDIEIVNTDGKLSVRLFNELAKSVSINSHYIELYNSTDDSAVREYLGERLAAAETLVKNVRQREKTILRCVEAIAETQHDFLTGIRNTPTGMSLEDISKLVGIHSSTVCRAIRDKYVQCDRGVFPLEYFFTRSLDDGNSTKSAQRLLKEIIDSENKSAPLSDQQLCELMAQKGVSISRRTISKYRDQLGIPSTLIRRQ